MIILKLIKKYKNLINFKFRYISLKSPSLVHFNQILMHIDANNPIESCTFQEVKQPPRRPKISESKPQHIVTKIPFLNPSNQINTLLKRNCLLYSNFGLTSTSFKIIISIWTQLYPLTCLNVKHLKIVEMGPPISSKQVQF